MKRQTIVACLVLAAVVLYGCGSSAGPTIGPSSSSSSSPSLTSVDASSSDNDLLKPYEEVNRFVNSDECSQLLSGFQDELGYIIDDVAAGNVDVLSSALEKCEAAGDAVPDLYTANGDPKSCSFVCSCARILSSDEASYLSACVDAAVAYRHGDDDLAVETFKNAQHYIDKVTADCERLADAYEEMVAEYNELSK